MVAPGKIRFGPYLFDLRQQRLSGPVGEVPLNLKSAVTEDALVQRVLDVREALGDNAKTPQYIRTHPKRG